MKRLMRMAVVTLLASVSCAASAQVWIGGNMSYTHAHVEAESGCYSNNDFIIGLTNNISFGLYINL